LCFSDAGLLFEMLRSSRKDSKSTWKVSFSVGSFAYKAHQSIWIHLRVAKINFMRKKLLSLALVHAGQ
jgi:hypothetical protein